MEMMRMMNDAEVKAKFLEVQAAMKEEGISFSPSDLAAFMNGGGMGSKQQQAGEESTQSLFQRIGNSFKSGKD
ncbi:hypothetical protein GGF46_003907 [Coemansia sp. RSA 552]|nr:hypothetical protein GGF46_003907 [Coemansia sp. RSA 552]